MTRNTWIEYLCHPSGMNMEEASRTGGIASLNPRLISDHPSGMKTKHSVIQG